jgi:mannosyltransferase
LSSAIPPADPSKPPSPPNAAVTWMLLGGIVVLALLLRCHQLEEVSYWFDESFCWKMSTFSWSEQWERVALDNHPPLYFYLLKGWVCVFGDSPLATRGLSVLCGALTIVGGYCLVSELERERRPDRPQAGQIAGLLTAAGLALAPMQIEWSQQLRMYSLGAALTVWSSYALVRALQPSTHRRVAGQSMFWRRPVWPIRIITACFWSRRKASTASAHS